MKWFQRLTAACLVAVLLVIVGCSANQSPKEAMLKAMTNVAEANSYGMKMTMTLDELELPVGTGVEEELGDYTAFVDMLKDASITIDAVYQKDPMRTDVMLELATAGSVEFKIKVPMIITDQIAYIKMPEIPMFPLPDTITGKFIELDLAEMTEGQQVNMEQQSKLGNDMLAVLMKHFDEKEYFSELKAADAGLPEGVKADQVIRVEVNNENFESTLNIVINKVIPEVIELLLADEESLKLMQLEKQDVESFKTDFEANKEEMKTELLSLLKVNELSLTGAIQDKNLVYQDMTFNVEVADEATGEAAKLGFGIDIIYSDINKTPKFENEIPTDTITIDQLMQLLQSPVDM